MSKYTEKNTIHHIPYYVEYYPNGNKQTEKFYFRNTNENHPRLISYDIDENIISEIYGRKDHMTDRRTGPAIINYSQINGKQTVESYKFVIENKNMKDVFDFVQCTDLNDKEKYNLTMKYS